MPRSPLGDVLWHIRRLVTPRQATGLTDSELLDRFVTQRDQAACEALLARHGEMVWGVCRCLLPDAHAAEDAFQATWLVFVRKAASIRWGNRLANWLYGVAHKVAARARANAGRQRAREREGVAMLASSPADDPAVRELNQVLHEELNHLPARYRTPMILCYLEGRTQEEAAEALGWTKGAVRGRLERGRERLRNRLARRGLALSEDVAGTMLAKTALTAALPGDLPRSTIKAVLLVAAGQTLTGALVSIEAGRLTEGVLRAMFISKLTVVTGVFLTASVLGLGTGVLAYQTPAAKQPAGQGDGPAQQSAQQPLAEIDVSLFPVDRTVAEMTKERLEAAREVYAGLLKEFQTGRRTADALAEWSSHLMEPELEAANTKAERIAALESHVNQMRDAENLAKARLEALRIPSHDLAAGPYQPSRDKG